MRPLDKQKESSLEPPAPITEDGKGERLTAETPNALEHSTVSGPMELPEWFHDLKALRARVGLVPFYWKQNYEINGGEFHWAINDADSEKRGAVSDAYTVLFADYPNACDGRPVSEQNFPKLIIAALNALPELLEMAEKSHRSLPAPESSTTAGVSTPKE